MSKNQLSIASTSQFLWVFKNKWKFFYIAHFFKKK